MVSTYLSFDLVNRDIQGSLKRIAAQTQVTNDAKYYNENIGKVTTVDEFIDDYRLFSYAMSAFGLGEMTYAKAFMKQVLESDLADSSSFANRMTDDRYKDFAAAFNFGSSSSAGAVAQSGAQMQDVFDLYDQKITSLNDVSEDETRYFKVMLETQGNVKNVDQFLRNDRLREYTFSAYGIDGTYFNYSAIRNVLTSDPADPNSYYNTAFGTSLTQYDALKKEDSELQERPTVKVNITTLGQSVSLGEERKTTIQKQIDDKNAELANGGDQETLQTEIAALQVKLADTTALVETDKTKLTQQQARLVELNAKLVPEDQAAARRTAIATELTPLAVNATYARKMQALAQDFQFNADGTVPAGGALASDKMDTVVGNFYAQLPQVTHGEAMFNQEYFEQKIGTITSVKDLLADERIYDYLRSSFKLDETFVVKSTLDQILTSDLSDPNSYANKFAKERPQYLDLAKAFNFKADGTVEAGKAQTAQQADTTRNNYLSRWDDKLEADFDKAVKFYKSDMASIKSLDEFLSPEAKTTYQFALKAVGIDADAVSQFKIRSVLRSDLSDPDSYVYQLKDERFVSLAKLFNFTSKGDVTVPVLAQSNSAITNVAKDYILRMTRHLEGDELEAAKAKAEKESSYYTETLQGLDNRSQLLADRRLLNVLLTAQGIDAETVTDDFAKKIFNSDLSDPESFVNKQDDKRFAQIVGSFNFDSDGEIDRSKGKGVQNRGEVMAMQDRYLRQSLESQQGDENPGVRLALYFQRMADSITDPYVIIGDDALAEFFRVTFSMPTEFANMDVDKQAAFIEKNINLEDLADSDKVKRLIERFTVMYDLENDVASSSAVSILTGSSGSAGISADTLFALSQIRSG